MKRYIILVVLLIVLGVSIFIAFNIINDDDTTIKTLFSKNKTYDEYKIGDMVSFNGDTWYVLYNSDKNTDYVTVINSAIKVLDEYDINYVLSGIYETSDLNKYLKNEYAKELGEDNLVEKNGYKVRLLNKDDFYSVVKESNVSYNKEKDEYNIANCPDFICLTNTFYATMIDTNNKQEFEDVYYNVNDIENIDYGDYTLHLNYYNVSTTYETFKLNSLADNATLFVRPVINVYKESLDK